MDLFLTASAARRGILCLLTTIILWSSPQALAQDSLAFLGKPELSVGYLWLSNSLNQDNYYSFLTGSGTESVLGGVQLKVNFPTQRPYLDWSIGALYAQGLSDLGSASWTPGNTKASDVRVNGGGVFGCISPKLQGRHVGLTADFGIGVFSFKQTFAAFNTIDPPFYDVYDEKTSHGLGALAALGGYVRWGRLGINPSFTVIYSGGSEASFTFYGCVLPLTYRF